MVQTCYICGKKWCEGCNTSFKRLLTNLHRLLPEAVTELQRKRMPNGKDTRICDRHIRPLTENMTQTSTRTPKHGGRPSDIVSKKRALRRKRGPSINSSGNQSTPSSATSTSRLQSSSYASSYVNPEETSSFSEHQTYVACNEIGDLCSLTTDSPLNAVFPNEFYDEKVDVLVNGSHHMEQRIVISENLHESINSEDVAIPADWDQEILDNAYQAALFLDNRDNVQEVLSAAEGMAIDDVPLPDNWYQLGSDVVSPQTHHSSDPPITAIMDDTSTVNTVDVDALADCLCGCTLSEITVHLPNILREALQNCQGQMSTLTHLVIQGLSPIVQSAMNQVFPEGGKFTIEDVNETMEMTPCPATLPPGNTSSTFVDTSCMCPLTDKEKSQPASCVKVVQEKEINHLTHKPMQISGVTRLQFRMETTPSTLNFRVKDVKRNGDCQFEAVVLHLPWMRPKELRRLVSDYLLHLHKYNPDLHAHFSQCIQRNDYGLDALETYARKMRMTGCFGDHITIVAMSHILNRNFWVYSSRGIKYDYNTTPVRDAEPPPDAIILGHIPEEVHYVAILRGEQMARHSATMSMDPMSAPPVTSHINGCSHPQPTSIVIPGQTAFVPLLTSSSHSTVLAKECPQCSHEEELGPCTNPDTCREEEIDCGPHFDELCSLDKHLHAVDNGCVHLDEETAFCEHSPCSMADPVGAYLDIDLLNLIDWK